MNLVRAVTETEDPLRRLLIQALTIGVPAALVSIHAAAQSVFGARPARLPPDQSIYRVRGAVKVNDVDADLKTQIRSGDTIETGQDGEIVFVVGGNSMILRGDSRLVLTAPPQRSETSSLIVAGLRLLTGKVLSVSRNRALRVETAVATIGIRGTGFYAEADPQQTYFCTCYGTVEIASNTDPESRETINAKHHDQPVYIVTDGGAGRNIRPAPVINHSDAELELVETLVGRKPPFAVPQEGYPPRDPY